MEQQKMNIDFANELWSKFNEKAKEIGLIDLAYNLERDEPPFDIGDGPRHPDAWLRYVFFRNKVEEMDVPLIEAILYSEFDCTIDADTNDVSFLVFPAPQMPEGMDDDDESEIDEEFYTELPDSEKLAFMTLYDEDGEENRLTKALEKKFGTYLIVMNCADKNHFDEFAEIIRRYKSNDSSVILMARNLSVTELDWFKEEFK